MTCWAAGQLFAAGFRCCYCYHVNEARKQRPRAPSLSEPSASTTLPPTQPGNTTDQIFLPMLRTRDVKQSSNFRNSVLKFEFDLRTLGVQISN